MPALLKGFFDRTFLPGFAFKYRNRSQLWDKLLSGRTADLLVTLDTPPWYFRWIYGAPAHRQMVRTVGRSIPEEEKAALLHGLTALNEFFQKRALELTTKPTDGGAKS